MNPGVDHYFSEGCGRCDLGGTPLCKVHNWQKEMEYLRAILLDCDLIEEVKWSVPCYTYRRKNVVILSAFKAYCALSFFKGSLLHDDRGILEKPGDNSQYVRLIKIRSVQEIRDMEPLIQRYILEAIVVEKAGLKPAVKKNPEPVPNEFQKKMDEMPALKQAFEALTPGRQRGYILHFSAPSQSKTRESRIEKCIPFILAGKGFHDR